MSSSIGPPVLQRLYYTSASGTKHPYYGVAAPTRGSPSLTMYSKFTCHPPLGHPTVVLGDKSTKVPFDVIIKSNEAANISKWEAVLWHNFAGADQWEALPFVETKRKPFTLSETTKDSGHHYRCFKTSLDGISGTLRPVSFTVKFRTEPEDDWTWIRDYSGAENGQIYYQIGAIDQEFPTYWPQDNPNLEVKEASSEVPECRIWDITMPADPAQGDDSGWTRHLVSPPAEWSHWFAVVRMMSCWTSPRQGTGLPLSEKDALLYSFLRKDGLHMVLLAISGIDDLITTLKYDQGRLVINTRNDREAEGTARLVFAIGKTFEAANSAAMYHTRKIVSPYSTSNNTPPHPPSKLETGPKPSWVEDWYDGFSYCTWNGLGQNLTVEKISTALSSLADNNIRITNLIIDDNWQTLDQSVDTSQMRRGWVDFEANPSGFPKGLRHAITTIRERHPHIAQVAVWHALMGYWGGISPDGHIAKTYKTVTVDRNPEGFPRGGKMVVIDAADVPRFYTDFYDFLSASGITAVKTDVQSMLDEIIAAPHRRALTNVYLDTWATQQLRHFSGRAISCMSQAPQIQFRSQLPVNQPAVPLRNSDDFFPDVEASHPWHIFNNAHNALFSQHLNVLPDWDMFQTDHPWSAFHAAARCVSGGPVYITDEPGKHDLKLIAQMTAQTVQGQTVVLRPSVIGKSTQAYVGYEQTRLVKVGTYVGMAKTGTGFLGVFNCRNQPIMEIITLGEFPGTEVGDYVVRSYVTGRVSEVMDAGDVDAIACLEVRGYGWEILTANPVVSIDLPQAKSTINVANLGLLRKMTGPAAIVNSNVYLEEKPAGRLRMRTTLKALGTLGIWISNLDLLDMKNDFLVLISGKPIAFHALSISAGSNKVFEVDVEKAWKEGGFEPGYSNEVEVEVFVKVQ